MSAHAPPLEVAPGVHRVSVPLPFPPGEVAAWVIEGDAGYTLVDTGIDTPPARGALRLAAEHVGVTPASLAWVVLTHAHIDHYGLAGPVRAWSGARVALHEREEELARRFVDRWEDDRAGAAATFRASGVPAETALLLVRATDAIHGRYADFRPDLVLRGGRGPLPGGGGWEWIHTPGHSPGHVTVYHPGRRILIAGDHVLPRISPNVGADLYSPDPLADYLASLRLLRDLAVDLVLPSHGEPFADLAGRADAIAAHHDQRNAAVLALARHPCTAYGVATGLFGALPPDNLLHAVRESLAHLIYLEGQGRVERGWRGEVEVWRASRVAGRV
ncbi:MAG TPA: MBL fold metallo-hydrolase [Longimicrobiaceae bacterium]|nr:MBL fold metallo-hydrolase [Longimicrobiaceae bacterium]